MDTGALRETARVARDGSGGLELLRLLVGRNAAGTGQHGVASDDHVRTQPVDLSFAIHFHSS